jgi:hypothetical protein
VTAALEPATSSTHAAASTEAADYDPILFLDCRVGLKPLYTSPEGEHCRQTCRRQREIGRSLQELTVIVGN